MINTSVSKNEHTIQSGVVEYSIGFPFYFNPDRTPQFLVKIGDEELRFNHNFELSEDRGSVVLRPTEEESWTLEGPEDFSWMAKWDGKKMLIERAVPFVQDSDYQVGRISSEQIERDFDLSVMRDQILATRMNEHVEDTQDEIDALHSRIDFVQEEHALDMAAIDESMAAKATKAELETAKSTLSAGILRNEQAIQDTRDDMNAKDSQLEAALNSHTGELTTLRGNQSALDGRVSGIEEKIPESASESNQLVTEADLAHIDLDDYVKKSGDTMTGDLRLVSNAELSFENSYGTMVIQQLPIGMGWQIININPNTNVAASALQATPTTLRFNPIVDTPDLVRLLGDTYYPWDNVYAKKLNNGADLNVPTEGGTLARLEDLGASLPDQTDNAGKFLTTDGTTTSWGEALVNTAVSTTSMTIGGKQSSSDAGLNIGWNSGCAGNNSVALGASAKANSDRAVVVGMNSTVTHQRGIAIGSLVSARADFAIQLGGDSFTENSDANTFKVANANGNFEMMSADGTIPAERMSATAGTTGQVLTKTDTGMEWQDASGGDSLPDQTDNAGKFLMTDGTTVSWGNAIKNSAEDPATDIEILTTNITDTNILIGGGRKKSESVTNAIAIGSKYSGSPTTAGNNAIAIGRDARADENASIAIGFGPYVSVAGGVAIGNWARVSAAGAIQLNARYSSLCENNEEGTFNVALGTINGGGGNYKLLDVDGTIPTNRYATTPTDAGTYVPKLTIAEDGTATREWGAESTICSDYLPLSGGTLTGVSLAGPYNYTRILYFQSISEDGEVYGKYSIGVSKEGFCFDGALLAEVSSIVPKTNGVSSLGNRAKGFSYVNAKNLYNGADLAVPTEGGTLARVEDITAAVGDISTALTAILGE